MLPKAFPRQKILPDRRYAMLGGAMPWQTAFRVALQDQTQWCWAAVSSSVAKHFRATTTWTQCSVASAEMKGPCCTEADSFQCNQPHYLDAALTRVGHLRDAEPGYLLPQGVVDELELDRPVCLRVGWKTGGGHFLAIVGLAPDGDDAILLVSDPIFGESRVQGSALLRGGYQAGGGTWTHSYVVQP